jgi:Divergent InlB B-repeat domain/PASTA domain
VRRRPPLALAAALFPCALLALAPAQAVSATSYKLNVVKFGAGYGTVKSAPAGIFCGATCQFKYEEGTEVELYAATFANSVFVGWTGACAGTGACAVTMSESKTVRAKFVPRLALAVSRSGAGEGAVASTPAGIDCGTECEAEYTEGDLVVLRAMAAPGSKFAGWSGDCAGEAACRVRMNAAKQVDARFERLPPEDATLTLLLLGSGSGVLTCDGGPCAAAYPEGTTVSLAAVPVAGSSFAGFTGACTGPAPCALTLASDATVRASFAASPPTAPATAARCLVPKLRGKTLKAAKAALKRADCALGKVSRPKKGGRKALRVRSSSPPAGTALAAGAKVGVRLAAAPKRRGGG